jgi:hypothetical protein
MNKNQYIEEVRKSINKAWRMYMSDNDIDYEKELPEYMKELKKLANDETHEQ